MHAAVRRAAPALLAQLDLRVAAPAPDSSALPAPAARVVGEKDSGQLPRPEEQPAALTQPFAAEPATNEDAVDAETQRNVPDGGPDGHQATQPAAEEVTDGADKHLLGLVQARRAIFENLVRCIPSCMRHLIEPGGGAGSAVRMQPVWHAIGTGVKTPPGGLARRNCLASGLTSHLMNELRERSGMTNRLVLARRQSRDGVSS